MFPVQKLGWLKTHKHTHTTTTEREVERTRHSCENTSCKPRNENCQHFCLVGKWWDVGGHGCCVACVKPKLVLRQTGCRMKLLFLFSLHCTTSALSLLIVLLGPWCITCFFSLYSLCRMKVCVFFILTHISTHSHSDCLSQWLTFLNHCAYTQYNGSFYFLQWLRQFLLSLLLFHSFLSSLSLSPPLSVCPLGTFFPFHCAITIHLFHLACLSSHYHFHSNSTPHHLSWKQPEMRCFWITMSQMLTPDSK